MSDESKPKGEPQEIEVGKYRLAVSYKNMQRLAEAAKAEQAARKSLEAQVAELTGKVGDLTKANREHIHRRVFEAEAAKAGVRADAIEDLAKLLGVAADSDVPDSKKIAEAIAEAKKSKAYFFAPVEEAKSKAKTKGKGDASEEEGEPDSSPPASAPAAASATPKAPSSGKQAAVGGTPEGLKLTAADLRDPRRMLSLSGAEISNALKNGLAQP